jgi:hypothetical protein
MAASIASGRSSQAIHCQPKLNYRFGDTVQRQSRINYQNMHCNRAPVIAVAK